MKKSYSNFTFEDIKALGLSVINGDLFDEFPDIQPSDLLSKTLELYQGLPVQSEKAKSEFLISPILSEVRMRNPKKITFFSGYQAFRVRGWNREDNVRDDLYRFEVDLPVTRVEAALLRQWERTLALRFEQRAIYIKMSDMVTWL